VAEDKKTQLGPPGRTHRPTGGQPSVPSATGTPAPVSPAATPAPGHSTSYLPEQPDPLLGKTVADRYLIAKKLGEGGMGTVYLATHTILEKQVALKVLHGEFARKPDLVERFIQEAKAASRIRHENVIDISDFGSTPDGLVFFAMELLQGHDLHDEVTRAKMSGHLLPWSRSKKIFLQICAALSAAHAKGIVHRDLKPENVYLVDFLGDPDFVKLLDFGIAKLAEADGAEGGRKLTKTGMLFGTPEYMSPEQARGEQVDHRVDIYAMGCILFQLVTGQVPFAADNFMGVLSMHLTEQPPTVAPETLDSIGAPRALADVIDRALAKDRNERWQTIDDLANAIREVCGDPAPADRSQPMRAASVPAPAHPTRAKPPTTPVEPIRKRPATVDQSSRIKTQWTGNLKVPEEAVEPAPAPAARSKLPLIIGAAVVVIGGGIAAFALSRGHSSSGDQVATPGSATPGSAAIVAPTPPPPPPPPPEPKLPDMVALTLDSKPHGATVTDIATGKVIGKTPLVIHTPGSNTPKQYAFHLHGYGDTTVELPLTEETFTYSESLVKGATGAAPVVHKVIDETSKSVLDLGAVTHPDTGSATAAVTHPDTPKPPDTGSAAARPPDTGSATAAPTHPDTPKPPDTGSAAKPPDQDCDEVPCLKGFGSNH
jgi:eukaryotic-like serine/threonine-protein kinase